MKLYTLDNNELMEISKIERDGNKLIVRGVIMSSIPCKAVLKPNDLRAMLSLLNTRLILDGIALFFKRS